MLRILTSILTGLLWLKATAMLFVSFLGGFIV